MPPKASAAPQANARVILTPEGFLTRTKPKSVKVTTAQAYVDGGSVKYDLPQTGLAHCIYVHVAASVVLAGTVSSGTWQNMPNPVPFALIRQMKFGSNNAFNMRQLTGWEWYKWLRYRYAMDPLNTDSNAAFSATTTAALGMTGTRPTPGANLAAGTFNMSMQLPIPVSYNEAAETGLLVLQQTATIYSVTIDWARVTGGIIATGGSNDVFNTLVGTGLTVTPTITISIGYSYFEVVDGVDNLISMFMSVNAQTYQPLAVGENVIRPPVNDFYTMMLAEVVNNGLPVTTLQNPEFRHSGNVYDYQDDTIIKAVHSYYQHRLPPMDGVIDYDLGLRRGLPSRRDVFDAFNDQNITDLQLRFTVPNGTTITGVNYTNLVMESLRQIRQ